MGHNFLEWAKSNFPLRQMKIASFIPLLCHFFPKLCLRLIPHLPAFILFCILILLKASRPLRSTKLARHSCRIPFMPHLVCVDGSWMLNGGWMVGFLGGWAVRHHLGTEAISIYPPEGTQQQHRWQQKNATRFGLIRTVSAGVQQL